MLSTRHACTVLLRFGVVRRAVGRGPTTPCCRWPGNPGSSILAIVIVESEAMCLLISRLIIVATLMLSKVVMRPVDGFRFPLVPEGLGLARSTGHRAGASGGVTGPQAARGEPPPRARLRFVSVRPRNFFERVAQRGAFCEA